MTLPNVDINVSFGVVNDPENVFIISDLVKGLIGSATYLIGESAATNVATDGYSLTVNRGRSRELDEFQVGSCSGALFNHDRTYDGANALSPYVGNVNPGKRIEVKVWDQTIFAGMVEDWDHVWSVDGDARSMFSAVDALGELGLREFDAWTTTAGQTAGPRLAEALDRDEVALGAARNFDTGATILQADSVTWGSKVLNYCQLVAKSDAGRFYASRENVLTFKSRHSLINAASSIVFTDDSTGVEFHGIGTTNGSELLFNRVGVDREGGTLQTVEDALSRSEVGTRSLALSGLLMDTDDQSEAMAGWLLSLYKTPADRVSEIVIKVDALTDAATRAAVTRLDLGDVVGVSWTPQGVGAPIEQTLVIEGVSHQLSPSSHTLTFSTSPVSQMSVFIIGDATYGTISGSNVIGF